MSLDHRRLAVPPNICQSERDLTDWLWEHPGEVCPGLEWLGREVPVVGGQMDLLGKLPDGCLVPVEVKANRVHSAEVVAQLKRYLAGVDLWGKAFGVTPPMAPAVVAMEIDGSGGCTVEVTPLSYRDGEWAWPGAHRMYTVSQTQRAKHRQLQPTHEPRQQVEGQCSECGAVWRDGECMSVRPDHITADQVAKWMTQTWKHMESLGESLRAQAESLNITSVAMVKAARILDPEFDEELKAACTKPQPS